MAQGVGRDFKLVLRVSAGAGNDGLHLGLLGGQLVKIGVFFSVGGVNFFQPGFGGVQAAHAGLHTFTHGLLGVQLGLLRQVTDVQTRHRGGFALDLLVHTRHDFEQGGLPGAVGAQYADLGAGEETERNVFENMPLGRHDLADAVHGENVLSHLTCGVKEREKPPLSALARRVP